ncbi:hypothetical protein VTN77DRAFT_5061 [Rasamsonia byssochlamydoides]|uniref:uncharacterized protein n=1 Tax=Rasamsonia byssochlamydoides TaxID=89139 RepID=UPI003742891D
MAESESDLRNAVSNADFDAKQLPWYLPELKEVSDDARRLLEEYSGIPSEKVVGHVQDVRDRAFAIFPYPCLGTFRFLNLSVSKTPYYEEVLQRVKNGETFLDLGCCFGQELRQLAFDGAPSENLYGSDLRLDFISLGYDLFLDKDKFKAHFIAADIFDDNSDLVKQLTGKVDIIYTGAFFHLFDLEQQLQIARRVVTLLRDKPGVLILGRQVGNVVPGHYPRRSGDGLRYRHDAASWTKLWEQVGEETGTKWKVDASLLEASAERGWKWHDENSRLLRFAVRRE